MTGGWALPASARREKRLLEARGITTWAALAVLSDGQLQDLALAGASSVTLQRLRGQARLVQEVGLEPPEAALLLHAGIPDSRSLARADPEQLWQQTGRLQRRLTGERVPAPDRAMLQRWISRARRAAN